MKRVKIITLVLLFVIVLFLAFIFVNKMSEKKQLESHTDNLTENELLDDELIEEEYSNLLEEKNLEMDIETNSNDNDIKEEKSTEEKKDTFKSEVTNSTVQETNEQTSPVEEVEKNIWDELGISEYDYYNKPMWSWARVDFSINEYKTEEKTIAACQDYGQTLFEQGIGFSCTSINSYSGSYLGEMLKTF
ncbi:MAG: hypothetical protein Q4G05_01730 [Clostridia bacterium]|nr:hypothetical protein [Clostridia bacterium]